jgi:hypothetical protein
MKVMLLLSLMAASALADYYVVDPASGNISYVQPRGKTVYVFNSDDSVRLGNVLVDKPKRRSVLDD